MINCTLFEISFRFWGIISCGSTDITDQLSVLAVVLDFFMGWMKVYVTLSLILFAVCLYACTANLNSLQQDIEMFHSIKMSPPLAMNRLKKWNRCPVLVCSTVDGINFCFQLIIFLSIPFVLLCFIHFLVKELSDCICLKLNSRQEMK